MSTKHTDVAVVGAGAMGALFGAILAEEGLDVVLIDTNRDHVRSIQTHGLKIEGYGGERTQNIPATSDASEIESANLILFQCKAYSTQSAARSVRHLVKENSVCISFQNGLGNEELIAKAVGAERVLGGVTAMAGHLLAPGRIRDFSRVPSYVGEIEGGITERVTWISEKLTNAGLEMRASGNIKQEIWKKLLGNISNSAISGLTNLTSATVQSIPVLKSVSLQAIGEAFEVAQASEIQLDWEAVIKGMELISQAGGTGDNKPSLLVDLLNKRQTEVDYIYGSVIRMAEEKGIQTPTLKVLHALIKGIEATF